MNEIENILFKIGLTHMEARSYIALLELQESQTGLLCKRTKISRSNIYQVLESLMSKGLATYRIHNNIKIFMPSPPEALNNLFLDHQKKLDEERLKVNEVISNLKKLKINNEPFANYKYFEGFSSIRSLLVEVESHLSKDDILKIYVKESSEIVPLKSFYDEFHKRRIANGFRMRQLFPFGSKHGHNRKQLPFNEVRFTKIDRGSEFGVVGEYFFISHLTGKVPRAFLIKDKIFADTFHEVFDNLWECASGNCIMKNHGKKY